MIILYITLAAAVLCGSAILISYYCFRRVFYSPPRAPVNKNEYDILRGKRYASFEEQFIIWAKEKRALPYRSLFITSFDGLTLKGKYYEYAPSAPIEILFHGYKGNAERDLCGSLERCFSLGRSALLVDQRGSGESEGSVISFGINECRDCVDWVREVVDCFGNDVEIVIGGVSMGAATVTMASALPMPPNVKYAVADCGYTTPREIIRKTVAEMKLPVGMVYPFIRLGAKLFGGFSIESNSPIEAVKKSGIPIIFLHGENDGFVPCSMSLELYESCVSPKKLAVIPGADHGLAYPVNKQKYLDSLREFESELSIFQKTTVDTFNDHK